MTQAEVAERDLAESRRSLVSAEEAIARLENELEGLTSDLAATEAELRQISTDLESAEESVADAQSAQENAENLAAELALAYSDELNAAMNSLAQAATEFACDWATTHAAAGTGLSSVSGDQAVLAFKNSAEFDSLSTNTDISTYLEVAAVLDREPFGIHASELEITVSSCWQAEDARLNSELYLHAPVLRSAALDAACTQGSDEVFSGFLGGYYDTAVYQSWQLEVGYDAADDYLTAVEERFGSISAFLAIPVGEIESESARCSTIRNLISPKSGGTWNVGDEIQPGTWAAYDVSDCYWARLAENGDIRANHFGDALRITVNVLASDGQFEISGCDFYFLNP